MKYYLFIARDIWHLIFDETWPDNRDKHAETNYYNKHLTFFLSGFDRADVILENIV